MKTLPKPPVPASLRLTMEIVVDDDGSVTVDSRSHVTRPRDLFRHYADAIREAVYEIERRPRD